MWNEYYNECYEVIINSLLMSSYSIYVVGLFDICLSDYDDMNIRLNINIGPNLFR